MDPNGADPKLATHGYGSQLPPPGQWTTGLFNCLEDPSNCFLTWCFPFVTFGQRAEVLSQGHTQVDIDAYVDHYRKAQLHGSGRMRSGPKGPNRLYRIREAVGVA
ncbi:hypothetical protein FNV43_RR20632 [Rhamnella rubrinervis]|uniref:Uncharacterized protein n=1 Tax=Rhamnella rubrinervis TaxID=2594499 RepID=A0A8K0GUC8_9ROSA|nr:hypothetical protein FNV43_RR20632 [Rhamnella rubrinervis]